MPASRSCCVKDHFAMAACVTFVLSRPSDSSVQVLDQADFEQQTERHSQSMQFDRTIAV